MIDFLLIQCLTFFLQPQVVSTCQTPGPNKRIIICWYHSYKTVSNHLNQFDVFMALLDILLGLVNHPYPFSLLCFLFALWKTGLEELFMPHSK